MTAKQLSDLEALFFVYRVRAGEEGEGEGWKWNNTQSEKSYPCCNCRIVSH